MQIVTPRQTAAGYTPPELEILSEDYLPGSGHVSPLILAPGELLTDHTYKVTFNIDTLSWSDRYPHRLKYLTNGYNVHDVTDGSRLVVSKARVSDEYIGAPIHSMLIDSLGGYSLDIQENFQTDAFEGLTLDMYVNTFMASDSMYDVLESGWKSGNFSGDVAMEIIPSAYTTDFPWEYEIIFGDPGMYETRTTRLTSIRDENGDKVPTRMLFGGESFSMQVAMKTFSDTLGNPILLDLVGFDADSNGVFELPHDRVFCGYLDSNGRWYRTLFIIAFQQGSELPQPNDVYRLVFNRPFFLTDGITFKVLPQGETDKAAITSSMDAIQVVPNPYVATNHMEPAVANQFLNQRRDIMFTHLPARCDIKIFTVSGVLVDEIDVENADDNGTAHWDVLTREGLEVAAGVYVYYVKAKETGDEKLGKFSIIK